jgi:chromosome segregation ATPase
LFLTYRAESEAIQKSTAEQLNNVTAEYNDYKSSHDGLGAEVHHLKQDLNDSRTACDEAATALVSCEGKLAAAVRAAESAGTECTLLKQQLQQAQLSSTREIMDVKRNAAYQLSQASTKHEGAIVLVREEAQKAVQVAETCAATSAEELTGTRAALESMRCDKMQLQKGGLMLMCCFLHRPRSP